MTTGARTPEQLLDLEFAYTSWDDSCRDLLLTDGADFRECRRSSGHEGDHASGFGYGRVTWPRHIVRGES